MKKQTFIDRIMSYLPKMPPPFQDIFARLQSYNLCSSKCINDWRDYDQCIESWPEPWYNKAELYRELYCTEAEAKSQIESNQVALVIPWVWKDTNQVNGISVQKKGGVSCTVIQDGHCFNVQTSLKIVMKIGPVRHTFLSKNQMY